MNFRPVIVVDTREQDPLPVEPQIGGSLTSGDYSILGCEHLFAVERKSISDLVGSVIQGRERFERELHRLRGFRFKRLLIEGTFLAVENHGYISKADPKAVLHSLAAFEARYDVPVVFGADRDRCARLVEKWAYWFAREVLQDAETLKKGIVEGET